MLAERYNELQHLSENALVSASTAEEFSFQRLNGDGSSSSVHASTEKYRERFPQSQEIGEVLQLSSKSLPDILAKHEIEMSATHRSLLVVDVQGHEMSVLHGLGEGLKQFSLCKCEVSRVPMYEGGPMFKDIDAHMKSMGFRLESHRLHVPRHGDVLYIVECH